MRQGSNADFSLHAVATVGRLIRGGDFLKQTGKSSAGGKYGYYSQNDLERIDVELDKHDCCIMFSATPTVLSSEYVDVNGKMRLTTYSGCQGIFRVQYVKDRDDWVEVDVFGYKVDMTSDKALGSATIAKRYGYFGMFSIPTTEGDPDGPDDVRHDLSPKPTNTRGKLNVRANIAGRS